MRIEVEIEQSQMVREVWEFNVFDQSVVFIRYCLMEKPKGKRKWSTINLWDKYKRTYQNTCKEPVLPDSIKELAKQKLVDMITVKTWGEWKGLKA